MSRGAALRILTLAVVMAVQGGAPRAESSGEEAPPAVAAFFDCLAAGDLDCLMAAYGEEPVLTTRAERFAGEERIREFLEPIAAAFRESGAWLEWRVGAAAGDMALVSMRGATAARYYEEGSIPFAIVGGKIARHTFEPGYEKYPNLGSWPEAIVALGGAALFFADDGFHGKELWRSDGTPEGTVLVRDLAPGMHHPDAEGWVAFGDRRYFCWCWDPSGRGDDCSDDSGLWATDGTAAGTVQIAAVRARCVEGETAAALDDVFVFVGDDGAHGSELWVSDGSSAGTRLLKDIRPGPEGAEITEPFRAGGLVFFGADDGGGDRLWRTDGTTDGTWMVKDLEPGPGHGRPRELARVGDYVFFNAGDGVHGTELWRTDGTPEGAGSGI